MTVELTILMERGEDGFWIASIPEIPGAFSQGKTPAKARANVLEALEDLMLARRELGIRQASQHGQFEKLAFSS